MYKATRGVTKEMYFTDDGFAMGVAYCLAILKQVLFFIVNLINSSSMDEQTRKNEALHWVDTVRIKYRADLKQLEQQQKSRLFLRCCPKSFTESFQCQGLEGASREGKERKRGKGKEGIFLFSEQR